ncbi:MAG: hypothetical protein CMP14_12115 [Rickettsiales bacterium]|nr:hypothetical protein [Rickettsiales bacterium]
MNSRLERFIESITPMVKHALNEHSDHLAPKHIRTACKYRFKQGFYYQLSRYLSQNHLVSRSALELSKELGFEDECWNMEWDEQPKYDPLGRKTFHIEHVYTGEMFFRALKSLNEAGDLNEKTLLQFVLDNYRTAWILKEEDKKLVKSNRGKTLQDALSHYADAGIELLHKPLESTSK